MGYCCGGIETLFHKSCFLRVKTTWVTAAAVLRQPEPLRALILNSDHMGYCCGGIETFLFFLVRHIVPQDHMGYCCGGIETRCLK